MGWLKIFPLVIVVALLSVALGQARAQEAQERQTETCSLPKGWDPAEDLPRILAEHRQWIEDRRPDGDGSPRRANLCNANLIMTNLTGTNLISANLTGTDLRVVRLTGANLSGATLIGADLGGTDLLGANLILTNLSGADLFGANLTNANLDGTKVTGARFAFVNLTDATYAPASPPPDPYLERIVGLSTVRFPEETGSGVVQLRELLQRAGLRDLEREATYAIESNKTRHAIISNPTVTGRRSTLTNRIEAIFRFVAFELTTGYGLYPGRALWIIVIFWAGLILVYFWPIHREPYPAKSSSGIYRIWSTDRIETCWDEIHGYQVEIKSKPKAERLHGGLWFAFRYAAHFSLLSAFHIGFREFNVGTWISRIQPREYTLRATGWVRVISGLQSLLSVYLLAIWALTYFGRPFQ